MLSSILSGNRSSTPHRQCLDSVAPRLSELPAIRSGSPSEAGPAFPRVMKAFPKTTSGEIGWQSSHPQNNLEVYGRYAPNARGQHGILKLLGWPRQSIM